MNTKHLILVTKKDSTISRTTREFTKMQKDSGEMQKYIELKTAAGFLCHEFDYSATYHQTNNLIKSIS